ncbi:hypothetical protein N4P43_004139, partial [Providencia stuartii]
MIIKMISFAKLSHRHLSGVSFEIKTTMKDKFGPNLTPNGGKLSEIRKDYIGNMKLHLDTSINSFFNDKNSYSLTIKEATLLKEINSSLVKNQIAGYKVTVGLDNSFNPASNNKYDTMSVAEDLKK